MKLCDYCGFEIKPGQRVTLVIATNCTYHRPCARRRADRMAKDPPPGKYGEIKTQHKKFHPGEPVFLIRGTDPFATKAIIDYARRCQAEGASQGHVDEVFDHAMRVAEWQRENPELVKPLPD